MRKERKEFTQLTREERSLLHQMRQEGRSFREIARVLGRGEGAAGSLCRELKRNRHRFPGLERRMSAIERGAYAHERASERRQIPRKKGKLASNPAMTERVIFLLAKEQASPLDISFRIAEEFPGQSLSYRTVYNFTKTDRTDLRQYLRLRGKPRRQRVKRRGSRFREGAPPKRNIEQRPFCVWDRSEFGHYEADTIHSCRDGSGYAILTVRELKSRKRWFFLLADLKAETTTAVLQGFLRMLPAHMRRTLTVDNGPENEHLCKLEQLFPGFKVYYCDAYCAWQRGSVENANGEFRWYHPKGTDFNNVSVREVWETQDKLNRRRMQCLKGKSAEMMFEHAVQHPPLIQVFSAAALASRSALLEAAGLRFERSSNLYQPSAAQ